MIELPTDRRGTAAIEFALVAPLMALMVIGLADTARHNLAMIDLDAAAHAGAQAAARNGADAAALAIDSRLIGPDTRIELTLIDCTPPLGRAAGCTALPIGRYAAVTTFRIESTLFGLSDASHLSATALVRLP